VYFIVEDHLPDLVHCSLQIQVLQMELNHEKERSAILEDRVNHLRRAGSDEGLGSEGRSEDAFDLRMQEADDEIQQLKADLLVSFPLFFPQLRIKTMKIPILFKQQYC
jgi:hypothetical protein